jgi:hypothetical protein
MKLLSSAIFSAFCYFPPFTLVYIPFLSTLFSHTFSLFLFVIWETKFHANDLWKQTFSLCYIHHVICCGRKKKDSKLSVKKYSPNLK